jgi:hypothetical protein
VPEITKNGQRIGANLEKEETLETESRLFAKPSEDKSVIFKHPPRTGRGGRLEDRFAIEDPEKIFRNEEDILEPPQEYKTRNSSKGSKNSLFHIIDASPYLSSHRSFGSAFLNSLKKI